jgi:hypothetical protein
MKIKTDGEFCVLARCPYCGNEYFLAEDTKLNLIVDTEDEFIETNSQYEYDAVLNTCINNHQSIHKNSIQYKII